MPGDGSSVERLHEYLQSLSPQARSMLIAELERALLRDEDIGTTELVLQELRRTIRAGSQPAPRIGDAARRFFTPLEPFLIDAPADHKRIGRLARVSLEPIWEWIGRDLMPALAKALREDINRALLGEDHVKVEQLVCALHDRAAQRLMDAIASLAGDDKDHRRFCVEVGTPRAVDDVTTLAGVLRCREKLGELALRLPPRIRAFEREIDQAMADFEAVSAQKSLQHSAPQKADFVLYGLIMLSNRLAAPWQLIRLATRAAGSDLVERVAATPYAAAVTIALNDLECAVGELRTEVKAGRPVASLLKSLHDALRGMRTEMDLTVDSTWSRQTAAIRTAVSNVLTGELETTTGRVRRLLRPHPAKEIAPGSLLDCADVQEVETRVELVGVCRHYAGEFAVSEVTRRTYSDLTQCLEMSTRILLDALRHAQEAERPFRQSQFDAAVRFCRAMFGADYAALLTKAADVAARVELSSERQGVWNAKPPVRAFSE